MMGWSASKVFARRYPQNATMNKTVSRASAARMASVRLNATGTRTAWKVKRARGTSASLQFRLWSAAMIASVTLARYVTTASASKRVLLLSAVGAKPPERVVALLGLEVSR